MNKLFFDVETIPAESPESLEKLKYLYERKMLKKEKNGNDKDKNEETFEDFVLKTSFDGGFGQALCIALAVNDDEIRVYCNPGDEAKTLRQFWEVAKNIDTFVGHNILDFDLKFLWQRSIVLGVLPTWQRYNRGMPKYLSFARYAHFPVFDTMHEWGAWGQTKAGLEHVALALGVPTPKEGIDGSEVYKFFKEGKVKEICEYCKRDVDTTREVYKKMRFEDQN